MGGNLNVASNSREYNRLYARIRYFLYRLRHPRKTPGVKPGYKFLFRAKAKPRPAPSRSEPPA